MMKNYTTKQLKEMLKNLDTTAFTVGFLTKQESDLKFELEMELINRNEYTDYLSEYK